MEEIQKEMAELKINQELILKHLNIPRQTISDSGLEKRFF